SPATRSTRMRAEGAVARADRMDYRGIQVWVMSVRPTKRRSMLRSPNDWTVKVFDDPKSGARTIIRKCVRPVVDPGDRRYPYLAYFTFMFQPLDETGLPESRDADVLFRIEEQEIPRLEASAEAVLVAVVSDAGLKDFLLYTNEPNRFLREAAVIRDAHPEFEVGCEVGRDAEWAHYKELP